MKSNLLKVSKVALLLVVIGFFMPISCDMNGVDIIRFYCNNDDIINALPLIIIIVSTCLSIIVTLYCILTYKNESLGLDWLLIGISVACGIYWFLSIHDRDIELQRGAYFIIIGWILSLVFLIQASLSIE